MKNMDLIFKEYGILEQLKNNSPKPRAEGSSPSAPAIFLWRKQRRFAVFSIFIFACMTVCPLFVRYSRLFGFTLNFRPNFYLLTCPLFACHRCSLQRLSWLLPVLPEKNEHRYSELCLHHYDLSMPVLS